LHRIASIRILSHPIASHRFASHRIDSIPYCWSKASAAVRCVFHVVSWRRRRTIFALIDVAVTTPLMRSTLASVLLAAMWGTSAYTVPVETPTTVLSIHLRIPKLLFA
jgi:hypothetical protein